MDLAKQSISDPNPLNFMSSRNAIASRTALTPVEIEDLSKAYFLDKNTVLEKSAIIEQLLAADSGDETNSSLYLRLAEDCQKSNDLHNALAFAMKSLMVKPKGRHAANLINKLAKENNLSEHAKANTDIYQPWKIPQPILRQYLPELSIRWSNDPGNCCEFFHQETAFPAQRIPLTAPKSLRPYNPAAYCFPQTKTISAETTTVPNGRLWFDGFNTVVWDSEGKVLEQLCSGYPEIIEYKTRNQKPLRLPGRVAQIGNRGATNYYHWMYDIIPKFAVLEASGIPISTISHFMVSGLKPNFQRQTFDKLGISNSQIHRPADGCFVTADEILIPTYGSNDHNQRTPEELRQGIHLHQGPWASHFLKKSFLQESPSKSDLKLYITRGDNCTRAVVNEKSIIGELQKYGFQMVNLGDYSICEQATLFSQANTVIGVHGAGLTNITYCQPGTKVLEIYGDYTNSCFWIISQLIGLDHYIHQVSAAYPEQNDDSVPRPRTKTAEARIAPVHIEIDELKKFLQFAEIRP